MSFNKILVKLSLSSLDVAYPPDPPLVACQAIYLPLSMLKSNIRKVSLLQKQGHSLPYTTYTWR